VLNFSRSLLNLLRSFIKSRYAYGFLAVVLAAFLCGLLDHGITVLLEVIIYGVLSLVHRD
jgi:hypothetical protein